MRLLVKSAWLDIKQGEILTTYPSDFVIAYFDAAVGLATVFLFVELGWKKLYNFDDPRPVLIAGLCFFHVVVFWINVHHFLKFSPERFTIVHVWLMSSLSLGLVFYPMSLNAWIDGERNLLYYIVNIWMCVCLSLLNSCLEIDERRANDLYKLYHRLAAPIAWFWYSLAFVLVYHGWKAEWMVYVAPFLYMCPLGAERKQQQLKED